jgi:hypothetical protein
MYMYESNGPNKDDVKFKEIEQLWGDMPIYPGMVETNSSSNSAGRKAHLSKNYTSPAAYEDVKRFYIEKLTQKGWQFVQEKQLSDWGRDVGGRDLEFRNGEYELGVSYAGEKADYGWNYSVGIYWYAK